jgi:repressor LexA
VDDPKTLKDGTIIAAHVQGQTTLKYYQRQKSKVSLQSGNPDWHTFPAIELPASEVEVQGKLVGVWRSKGV